MNQLHSIMAYFCIHYPHKSELSKARLTKLVYLADWFSALLNKHKATNINWVFNHYGPYVDDVSNLAQRDENFSIVPEKTVYGGDKYVISYSGDDVDSALSDQEKAILNAIIEKTESMYFNDFIDYVYSTYPISSNERYTNLDLVALANRYKEEKKKPATSSS